MGNVIVHGYRLTLQMGTRICMVIEESSRSVAEGPRCQRLVLQRLRVLCCIIIPCRSKGLPWAGFGSLSFILHLRKFCAFADAISYRKVMTAMFGVCACVGSCYTCVLCWFWIVRCQGVCIIADDCSHAESILGYDCADLCVVRGCVGYNWTMFLFLRSLLLVNQAAIWRDHQQVVQR